MNVAHAPKLAAFAVAAAAALLLPEVLAGCSASTPALSPSPANVTTPAAQRAATRAANASWSRSLVRVPLPGAGCFKASNPSMTWLRIACANPQRLAHSRMPAIIGSWKGDYFALTSANMSMAIGSFPNVTGVTSVRTVDQYKGHDCSQNPGQCGKNIWGLQINTPWYALFPSSACKAAKPAGSCAGGWEQFFYGEDPNAYPGMGGTLGIEDWLFPKTGKKITVCPPGAGWGAPQGGACTKFSPTVPIPHESIASLGDYILAAAATHGGLSIYLTVGSTTYGMANIEHDATGLAASWKGAEFNVFGNCCAYRAVLNPGSTITVRLETVTGDTTAPTCHKGVGTGEQNNLAFVTAPSNPMPFPNPSILFTESNAPGGGAASCDVVPGSGT